MVRLINFVYILIVFKNDKPCFDGIGMKDIYYENQGSSRFKNTPYSEFWLANVDNMASSWFKRKKYCIINSSYGADL